MATLINTMLLIVILAAIVLSVLLSQVFARSFAGPVQSLSAFAEEIGGGNLAPQAFSFRDVEFDTLAGSMNRMASELQEAKQKQETFFQKPTAVPSRRAATAARCLRRGSRRNRCNIYKR